MADRWYDKTVTQIEDKLNTDSNTGLAPSVLKTRQRTDKMNVVYPITHYSFESCVKKVVSEPFTLILLAMALISAWLEQSMPALVIVSIVVFNIIVSVFSYNKSYKIFEDMGRLSLPTTKVLRNGKMFLIKSEQLVQGDVIYLSAGDIVPADARLVESDDLQVLEVNLTGVIKPTEKDPYFIRYNHDVAPAQQANMVFASSIVIKGTAKAICCCMGEDTLVCKLKKNKSLSNHDDIEAISFAKKFSKGWFLGSVIAVFAIIVLQLFCGSSDRMLIDIFLTAISFSVAAVGEFFVLSSYVIVANGLFSAVKQSKDINSGALIKNVSKIEQLKEVDCLLIHKDGAFSVRNVKAERIYANSTLYTEGEVHFEKNVSRPLRFALISTGLYGAGRLIKNNLNNNNIYTAEEDAIISIAQKCNVYNIQLDRAYPIIEHVGVSDTSRFETTLANSKQGYTVACRGPLEAILSACTTYCENGNIYPLDPDKRSEIIAEAVQLNRRSYRVIGIASNPTQYNTLRRISACQSDMTFEGFVAIRERMLPGAARNIADCQSAGMKIVMICDDAGEHNRALAESLGIIKDNNEVVSGKQLAYMKEDLFRTNVSLYNLYEGVSIQQKRKIIEYLHDEGHSIAVLARELDEIILLKEADVGIVQSTTLSSKLDKTGIDMTMAKNTNSPMLVKNSKDSKKTGSEALKFIADVIVSDADKRGNGGFNAVIKAIGASKIIYKNMVRFFKYMLTIHTARLTLLLMAIFTNISLFTPVQIIFSGLVIDFVGMVIIAFETPDGKIMPKSTDGYELRKLYRFLPLAFILGLVCAVSVVSMPYLLKFVGVISLAEKSTVMFVSFTFAQITLLNIYLRDNSIFKPTIRYNRAHLIMLVILIAFCRRLITLRRSGTYLALYRLDTYHICCH